MAPLMFTVLSVSFFAPLLPVSRQSALSPRAQPPTLFLAGLGVRLNPAAAEAALLDLVDAGGLKREILDSFTELETVVPAPDDLLLTDRGSALADGRWTLLGSIAARVGDNEEIADSGISNAINASGIVVDAATLRKPVQEIDVRRQRIANELYRPLPLGQSAIIRVAGSFAPRPDQASGRRAYVNFDSLEFFLETDAGALRVLSLGWLFDIIQRVRPALTDGDADGPWLETTYLSDRVRLGRGNKGSIFILRRSDDSGEGPLAKYPL
mmetsp:Transcript_33947/g.56133  ORF Transcript_33947/g.56133 Transcript_33947/m.56133 type:complete len:268 (-) Transcript_33947:302-1105(-)|eukprot:CAMPEP_0119322760 /NCGR_PEP_ID=MMETSP1333-20130426/59106_1 /TAXON_ID=418940 /ORGANISM="Scyphosphaera apsteinii, Strain RCC1455" /LENGTH=267 /DNA_ID=CAMNT_0007330067 /DNA_START=40 /DNA_END=843 /DNA_ORIENTATION=+